MSYLPSLCGVPTPGLPRTFRPVRLSGTRTIATALLIGM
jgi:hypothetical protein